MTTKRCSDPKLHTGEDYAKYFEPEAYIQEYVDTLDLNSEKKSEEAFILRKRHEFFTTEGRFKPNSSSVLEFGGGASLSHLISATPFASEIVFSDYAPPALEAVKQWQQGHSQAYNWDPFFEYVIANLEKNSSREAPKQRISDLKKKMSAIISCDIRSDKPLEGWPKKFDVVCASLCLEVACRTYEEYKEGIRKLRSLLNKSGWLLLNAALGESSHYLGKEKDEKFFSLTLTADLVKEAIAEANFEIVDMEEISVEFDTANASGSAFVAAQLLSPTED